MRQARYLVALLLLLPLPAAAQGSGAWVLWMQSRAAGQPEYTRVDTFPSNIPGRPQVICARWARTFGENPDFKDKTFICLPEAVDPRGPAKKRR